MRSYAQAISLTMKNDFEVLQPTTAVLANQTPFDEGGGTYSSS